GGRLFVLWIPAVLGAIFAALFWGGGAIAAVFDAAWQASVSPRLGVAIRRLLGEGAPARVALWGVDAGLNAVLSVAVTYVLTFYLIMATLQDAGVLDRLMAALDRLSVRTGVTAAASLPLIIGAGCNVPAILSLRGLPGPRHRAAAGTLVTLVPCSARTAVVFGTVGYVLGWPWAVGLYAIVAAVILAAGHGLRRMLPRFHPPALRPAAPLRLPRPRRVAHLLWPHLREFTVGAIPFVVAGSLILGVLYETGIIGRAAAPLAPVIVGWLRLPPAAGLTLVFAVLRKELALQLLLVLAAMSGSAGELRDLLTPGQIFTYALVNTIAVPCTATIGVLARVAGWRRTAAAVAGTLAVALLLGGAAARLLALPAWPITAASLR
ncbi:MAG TPA: nucleoside recognition domain-containing protein, partial [bacterium]|nr:nucleoside recognition domain-containing protein [bacterium]